MAGIRRVVLVSALAAISLSAGCGGSSTSQPSEPGTGGGGGPTSPRHLTHLRGAGTSIGLACTDCHAPSGFNVDFSQSTKPHLPGRPPSFDPATKTCSNVHCHGNFQFNSIPGTMGSPRWDDPTPLGCGDCHALPPPSHMQVYLAPDPTSCSTCHRDTVNPDGTINMALRAHLNGAADVNGGGCTTCHGDARRLGNLSGADAMVASAPPVARSGASPNAVGAHVAHLNPRATGALATPTACAECHVVPTDALHASNPPPSRVTFGPRATAQGARPAWDPAAGTCASTYCHGNFDHGGVTGARATAAWNSAAGIACDSCHGLPPAGHPPLSGTVTAATCSGCHPATVRPDGSIDVAGGAHLNGLPDTGGLGCTVCHGDATRIANLSGADPNLVSSPPVVPASGGAGAVGAHLAHVNPTASGAIAAPIPCSACHVVPSDTAHARTPPPSKVVFGGTSVAGGAAPTWTSATATCSATYCHGNFDLNGITGAGSAVTWTGAAAPGCTSCHAMPPAGHVPVASAPAASSCAPCHSLTVNADGTINMVDRAHLNGRPDVSAVGCTACHGDAARVANMAGTDANLPSAPPAAPRNGSAWAVGAHMAHVNPAAATARMKPIACAVCHPVPGDAGHAASPPPSSITFTGISVADPRGPPAWNPVTGGCSATYCHGNFNYNGVAGRIATVTWDGVGTGDCTFCHAMPPANHAPVTGAPAPSSCNPCHPDTVSAAGVIDVNFHIDGKPQGGGCGTCHALPPATGQHQISDHVRRSCDACHPQGYTSSSTVGAFHANRVVNLRAEAGYSCGLVGCAPGVKQTCTNRCHGPEDWN